MMPGDSESLLNLLNQHQSWYPWMELRDIYKLIYQGVLGSEHLITSPLEFTRQLAAEFDLQPSDQHQRLLESIRPDQMLFRLNLRAYKSRHRAIDPLFHPLLETAHLNIGTKTDLSVVWSAFRQLCEQGHIGEYKISTILAFSHWLAEMGFPAVHHSEIYRVEYQPAYRLIAARYIPATGLTDAS